MVNPIVMPGVTDQDRLAFDLAMVVEPVWNRLEMAKNCINLDSNVILHAGPKFVSPDKICQPILNSACVAAVFEEIATQFGQAESMIRAGEIKLLPAQDYNVVTPLAAVVSASMILHSVYDAHRGQLIAYAPLNGGNGPAPRLGIRSIDALNHLEWINDMLASAYEIGLAEGIDLLTIAAKSMFNGDDCHGRTPYATSLLINEINERTPGGIRNNQILNFLDNSPNLFLNLWMAATKCALLAAEGHIGSSLVTAAGCNGVDAGIKISGLPDQWFTAPAKTPKSDIKPNNLAPRALGAIGDSAIIDAFGLGAMAMHLAPEQEKALGKYMPFDSNARRNKLMTGSHVGFRNPKLNFGLTAQRVMDSGLLPLVSLGILDSTGKLGRLGGGIFEMPAKLFSDATTTLETTKA